MTTTLYASFKEYFENKDWIFEAFITQLNAHLLWIENHEREIQKALLDADMVSLATNDWMEGWEVDDEDDDKTYYELDNGELFPYPITEDVF